MEHGLYSFEWKSEPQTTHTVEIWVIKMFVSVWLEAPERGEPTGQIVPGKFKFLIFVKKVEKYFQSENVNFIF